MAGTAVRGRLTWQTATVGRVTRETASAVTLLLEVPDWPDHRAGQHVDIRLTADDGYQAERAYSIASAPGEPLATMLGPFMSQIDDSHLSLSLSTQRRVKRICDPSGESCGSDTRTAIRMSWVVGPT